MSRYEQFFIGGQWVAPTELRLADVVNPATEEVAARIALGSAADVDTAVAAARAAFAAYQDTSRADRLALLHDIHAGIARRRDDLAEAITTEMGCPLSFSRAAQAERGLTHLDATIKALEAFAFEQERGSTRVVHEPIGVCGLITPWNWPINQIACKVYPALAAGCTIVLKPSELSPLSALIFAEILDEAGVPSGVFNLVNGDGAGVGAAISAHPDIDMVSFTGSTRAGILVAQGAAPTVKRVAQELGGKSANILLPGVDYEMTVTRAVAACFANAGQSCSIPTRLLVQHAHMDEAAAIAGRAASAYKVGSPLEADTQIGPIANRAQFEKVQELIARGIEEGAALAAGGTGRPEGLNRGYYVRPTVFSHVTPDMTIAQEEIFGPVLSVIGYEDVEEAIAIANGTPYGLAAYVQSPDLEEARRVGRRMRAGMVHLNYPPVDLSAPFGGYKRSGNGREWGDYGLAEYLEVKSMIGYAPGA
ncbi:aldehyde dehydrogenase family protein [Xanthobacter sediminis]